eukprot:611943-Prymnesium_polylepis.1
MGNVGGYRQSREDFFDNSRLPARVRTLLRFFYEIGFATMGKGAFSRRRSWRHCRSFAARYKHRLVLVPPYVR